MSGPPRIMRAGYGSPEAERRVATSGDFLALSVMFGSKRIFRHGLFISAAAHLGLLAIGLLYLYLGASSHEAPPPDATLVEIVTPKDIPRFSGMPSELRNSGMQAAAKSQPEQQERKEQKGQKELKDQRDQKDQKEKKDQRKAERDAAGKSPDAQTAAKEPQPPQPPPLRQTETADVSVVQPPAPPPEETPDAREAAATMAQLAQLALLGGRLGGGFAAPPVNSPLVGYDYTLAFRERVSSCAPLPPGIDRSDKISVGVRIFLNRDGTVAKTPQPLDGNLSAKQQALFQNFVNGLEKCQPYTMLPADKYQQWKTLDVLVYPLESYGG
jgi:hypothetical protein